MANIVEERHFNKADVSENNNKFWSIYLYDDGAVETHWGRVGYSGQRKVIGHGKGFYDQKVIEKGSHGYKATQTIRGTSTESGKTVTSGRLAQVATGQIQTDNNETRDLVSYLVSVNRHNILSNTTIQYDESRGTYSTPLGVVTAEAISCARLLLDSISKYVIVNDYESPSFIDSVNEYLQLIPQNIGMRKPNLKYLYPNIDAIQKQNSILDSLESSVQMVVSSGNEPNEEPKLFEVSLSLVTDKSVIDRITKLYVSTQQSMHSSSRLRPHKVFKVEIASMSNAFANYGANLPNIWDGWHGTRSGNLLSIMQKGFIIPPSNAPYCTGRMFGNGIYTSDQSTKALNYSDGYWSGTRSSSCYMFLCDVAMGKYYVPNNYGENLPKSGHDSTFAKANKSGVMNNEWIVYRTDQINPKYLIEFTDGGR